VNLACGFTGERKSAGAPGDRRKPVIADEWIAALNWQ